MLSIIFGRFMLLAVMIGCLPLSALAAGDAAQAEAAMKSGKLSEAISIYGQLVVKNPKRADLHLRYAKALKAAGQTEPAIEEFTAALKLDPHLEEAYVTLGEISLQILDVQHAMFYALAALGEDPDNEQARIILINAWIKSGHTAEADQELGALINGSRKPSASLLHLAYMIKSHQGDMVQARKYLRQAVAVSPERTDWMLELCKLLESGGDYRTARSLLEEALQHNPNLTEARLQLARGLEVYDGNYDAAIQQYSRVLERNPSSPAALTGLDRCRAKKNDLALRWKRALNSWFNWD